MFLKSVAISQSRKCHIESDSQLLPHSTKGLTRSKYFHKYGYIVGYVILFASRKDFPINGPIVLILCHQRFKILSDRVKRVHVKTIHLGPFSQSHSKLCSFHLPLCESISGISRNDFSNGTTVFLAFKS